MDKRYQIFVSSTYTDLLKEREIVMQTLMKMDCIPAGMELFPAADEEQFEFIKKVIDDCDYYLLIISGRYGSVTSEGLSYTEKEYNYAIEKGIKVIALIHEKPDDIPSNKSETLPKLRKRLEAFRNKVAKNRLVNFWTEASQLSGLVALGIMNAIRMYPAVGWVRANQVANTELLTELNELRKNKERLEMEIGSLKSSFDISIFTPHEESEFTYIYKKFENLLEGICNAQIQVGVIDGNPQFEQKDCLIRYSFVEFLLKKIERGTNKYVSGDLLRMYQPKNTNKSFSKFIDQGFRFSYFTPFESTKGLLTTLGLLTPILAEEEYGLNRRRNTTIFLFSEKLYKFASWLDYHNKTKSEPQVEFVQFLEESDPRKDL